jgi:hypothetical protein
MLIAEVGLRLVPANYSGLWKSQFLSQLKAQSSPWAQKLATHLEDPKMNRQFHKTAALEFLKKCQAEAQNSQWTHRLVGILAQRRAEAFHSEISKNPLGQILEPGFRVIFPNMSEPSERLNLDANCDIR